ncbi:DUF3090 domain-containing protein [Segeticoccus rhizosphaerae]|jgi:uncharacterized repeat protein (TIGR03847 family)|uniref:DUF3090 domain-containing protein n=1 Tax=Segeticoccus rhizosphaerae TaxID=1104777 RepID=UPI0010C103F3|nr:MULTISPECIES: DUF3090 domain-containing protein [Intrasporangiaceae]
MPVIEFDPPERFVAGTVGPPGQRTFFLQARSGRRLTSVSLEKEQVSVLADRLDDLLDQVAATEDAPPAATAADEPDNEPLDTPIEDEFRVGSMSLAWDAERSVVVIECHDGEVEVEAVPGEEEVTVVEVPEDQTILRVVIGPQEARSFAGRCQRTVKAGRPDCPFCGGPLDPTGHVCPRANGYKR